MTGCDPVLGSVRIGFDLPKNDDWDAWRRFHESTGLPTRGCLIYPYQPIPKEHMETVADVWWDSGMRSLEGVNVDSLIGQHCDLPSPIGLWEKP